ncbi:hypothetical protein BMS93_08340 [Leuconostoc pseudomesenteroides]|nr:hypothetical protein BMS86_08495 [Leuconostoc pseudomesenteroides]ORI54758.1 hypothetical protein BMS87_08420 [Leuconostoc pseudomesenteroides]ORI74853.1 hypothetical protein BMS89_08590 [Leuconostoc pseudomesenteroides]ORI81122.1 hypothetical protein BMS93_08340 [Leuconostoc pseudomesenteroides]
MTIINLNSFEYLDIEKPNNFLDIFLFCPSYWVHFTYDNDEMLAFLRENGTIIAHVGHIVTVVFSDFDESIGIKLAGSDFKFIEELPIGSEDIFRASFASEAYAWQKELEGE